MAESSVCVCVSSVCVCVCVCGQPLGLHTLVQQQLVPEQADEVHRARLGVAGLGQHWHFLPTNQESALEHAGIMGTSRWDDPDSEIQEKVVV